MNKRPELDLKNPPGQITYENWRPPRYLRDVIKAAQERSSEEERVTPQPDYKTRLEGLQRALMDLCGGVTTKNPEIQELVDKIRKILKENA